MHTTLAPMFAFDSTLRICFALQAPLDTSDWTEVAFKGRTPQQQNGHDCGVFMTRTADYVARDGLLDFSQADMTYFRRRMVLEILRKSLL